MIISNLSLDTLPGVAAKLIEASAEQKIILFYGEMGAGKTTFIKAFCRLLGVKDNVASPTFSIVNEYCYPEGTIYHFDCYRLKNQHEALDIGLEEYLDSGNYCLIEWPEKIPDLLPEHFIKVSIQVTAAITRTLTITKI